MILIPEIETVIILVPRTGSGSLRRAVAKRYPQSMQIYRHMEADGIPHGYDRWRKIGVVRHPVERLWSLYKFMKTYSNSSVHHPDYIAKLRRSAGVPFDDWLIHNETAFTDPYDLHDPNLFRPYFTVLHSMAENRKSAFIYLRPDLGTEVYRFQHLHRLARELDLAATFGHENQTSEDRPPPLTLEAQGYIRRAFAWDFEACGTLDDEQEQEAA